MLGEIVCEDIWCHSFPTKTRDSEVGCEKLEYYWITHGDNKSKMMYLEWKTQRKVIHGSYRYSQGWA